MGEEISSAINLSVDLLIAAMVIGTWSALMYMANYLGRYQQAEADSIKVIQEYRKYNQYDATVVAPQDIVNLIFESRGTPEVWVDTDETDGVSFDWKWTATSSPCPYTATDLTTLLPSIGTYDSSIIYDANGAVLRFEFRR